MTYAHSAEAVVMVDASAEALFDYLDDQERLGSHMQKPSMMMMGGRMTITALSGELSPKGKHGERYRLVTWLRTWFVKRRKTSRRIKVNSFFRSPNAD
ncbi:MAG: hypothetical protein JWM58_4305 [Rhizobium sp.]|nr:hypothetical protein [Rhizobium sp.]